MAGSRAERQQLLQYGQLDLFQTSTAYGPMASVLSCYVYDPTREFIIGGSQYASNGDKIGSVSFYILGFEKPKDKIGGYPVPELHITFHIEYLDAVATRHVRKSGETTTRYQEKLGRCIIKPDHVEQMNFASVTRDAVSLLICFKHRLLGIIEISSNTFDV